MAIDASPPFVVFPVKDLIDEFEQRTSHLPFRGGDAVNYLADACSNIADCSNGQAATLDYIYDMREQNVVKGKVPAALFEELADAVFDMHHSLFNRYYELSILQHEYDTCEYAFKQVTDGCLILSVWGEETEEEMLDNYIRD